MKIEIHFHDDSVDDHSPEILPILAQILTNTENLLMQNQQLLDLIGRVDTATTNIGNDVTSIAAKLDALRSQISTSMSTADVTAANELLGSSVARLETAGQSLDALGSDPENPVPATPPAPADSGSNGSGSSTSDTAPIGG